jgi:hypothetical protein
MQWSDGHRVCFWITSADESTSGGFSIGMTQRRDVRATDQARSFGVGPESKRVQFEATRIAPDVQDTERMAAGE